MYDDAQIERLVLIGRLVTSIVHEINNPMQAIRGALTLILEEVEDPEAVRAYTQLCLQESNRVIKLTQLLRQIYRPDSGWPEILGLNDLIRDCLSIARDELIRQNIFIEEVLSMENPLLRGVANQLVLSFTYLLFNLLDAILAAGGGDLQITTFSADGTARVEFSTPSPLVITEDWPVEDIYPRLDPHKVGVLHVQPFIYEMITAHRGEVQFDDQPGRFTVQVSFPRLG